MIKFEELINLDNALKQTAYVREEECIGCTKCLQACPVDAILGGPKQMHTVLLEECIGCQLCVPPCPVDCIEMHPSTGFKHPITYAEQRFNAKLTRVEQAASQRLKKLNEQTRRSYIQQALMRARAKRKS